MARPYEHTTSSTQTLPIGHRTGLNSIKEGIKQWGPDLAALPGDLADALYYAGRKILRGQSQASIPSLGAGAATRRWLRPEAQPTRTELTATPETNWTTEATRFLNPAFFLNPSKLATSPLAQAGAAVLGAAHGMPPAALGVIRPKGGNWGEYYGSPVKRLMKGEPEVYHDRVWANLPEDVQELYRNRANPYDEIAAAHPAAWEASRQALRDPQKGAYNDWLNGPFMKYIKTRMGSPDDELVKLADEGVFPLVEDVDFWPMAPWARNELKEERIKEGFDPEGIAKTNLGAEVEAAMDRSLRIDPGFTAEQLAEYNIPTTYAGQPFMQNLEGEMLPLWQTKQPNVRKYSLPEHTAAEDIFSRIAFDLDNLLELPSPFQIQPHELKNMSLEKLIRRRNDYLQYQEAEHLKRGAEMLQGPASKLVQEYPDGSKWYEFIHPGTPEGDDELYNLLSWVGHKKNMNHCVGGYCPLIENGDNRVFSLHGPDNKPHVTVDQTKLFPKRLDLSATDRQTLTSMYDAFDQIAGPAKVDEVIRHRNPDGDDIMGELEGFKNLNPELVANFFPENHPIFTPKVNFKQIFGNSNSFPKEEYHPAIQDLVKRQRPQQIPYDPEDLGLYWHGDSSWDTLDDVNAKIGAEEL